MDLKTLVRDFPDFPKPGIMFKDISPLLANPQAMNEIIDQFYDAFKDCKIDYLAGPEARGFGLSALLARRFNIGFIMLRKPNKLPGPVIDIEYGLEYGKDTLAMQEDAIKPGDSVLIIDDLLATGGTAKAAGDLIEKAGGSVAGFGFVVEIAELSGRSVLTDYKIESLITF